MPARKKPAPKKRTRAPGAGRPHAYGEPSQSITVRLPLTVLELLDGLGPSRTAALVGIVRGSVQYRLAFPEPAERE